MGVTAYAYLRYGVPCSRSDFFEQGDQRALCDECGERPKHGGRVCQECGGPIKLKTLETPTEHFKRWAEQKGTSPDDLFVDLVENGDISPDKDIQSGEDVSAIMSGREHDMILCVKLRQASDYSNAGGPLQDHEFEAKKHGLRQLVERMGLGDRRASLYCQLYWSF